MGFIPIRKLPERLPSGSRSFLCARQSRENSSQSEALAVDLEVEAAETLRLGGCQYPVLRVKVTTRSVRRNSDATNWYSPQLGTFLKNDTKSRVADKETRFAREATEIRVSRRGVALAKCAEGLQISGGPWFSSTYSVGANDKVRAVTRTNDPVANALLPEGGFLCIYRVEYIGAAVNPYGGNAARARFHGFDGVTHDEVARVYDFPY